MILLGFLDRNVKFTPYLHLWKIGSEYYNLLICVDFFMIEYNKSKNRNVLDVRASLKVGLQMEQGKLPSH